MKKTVSKALIGTVAAGAMAVSATPAMAGDRDRDGGISAGEVIAGAVILGGIAAIASAASKDRDRYRYRDNYRYRDQRYRYNNSWRTRGTPRNAVQRCVNAAEREARRYGYRFANVTDIRDVDDTRYGWKVKGRIVVDGQRGYGYRGYNHRYRQSERGYDKGKFTCRIDRGRGAYVDFSGIRGLH